jgi:hypothetical protein
MEIVMDLNMKLEFLRDLAYSTEPVKPADVFARNLPCTALLEPAVLEYTLSVERLRPLTLLCPPLWRRAATTDATLASVLVPEWAKDPESPRMSRLKLAGVQRFKTIVPDWIKRHLFNTLQDIEGVEGESLHVAPQVQMRPCPYWGGPSLHGFRSVEFKGEVQRSEPVVNIALNNLWPAHLASAGYLGWLCANGENLTLADLGRRLLGMEEKL